MVNKGSTISQLTLREHFSLSIHRESKRLLPPLSDELNHYLIHLLLHFSESRRLFCRENDNYFLPTLALIYETANNAKTSYERNIMLRQLGDSALFMGALFFEHFSKKGINKDYFIGMGGGAYHALADYEYGDTDLFYELAERFPKLLQVISRVCTIELNYNAEDIFSLLKRWQNSKDATLRKQLHSIGIIPFELSHRH